MNGEEPAIKAVNLRKSYLRNEVLRGFSLTVPRGKMFGCAGVNGAGKSTFLKCLLDFCHFSGGDISIFGVSSKQRAARERLCFLPERFIPPYYLNGRRFVKMVLRLNSQDYSEDETLRIFEALDLDESALGQAVRSFSKGMTQKLGLAACFLLKRDLYIFDEPMSGLDPKARALLKRQLSSLLERGATVFFTSHSLTDIREACDMMTVLHNGVSVFTGTPGALEDEYGGIEKNLEDAYLRLISNKTDI